MTLQEWSQQTGIMIQEHDGCKFVLINRLENYHNLWRLSDYGVSSVCGITIWLFKR